MRAYLVPLVAVGAVLGTFTDEPSERQMRHAFEGALALQVHNVLDFAEESGGPGAAARIRDSGMDRFAIRAFRKLECQRDEKPGYACAFTVEIGLVDRDLQGKFSGRFVAGPDGLVFAGDG
jgi:hypothetical protein